MAEGQQEMAVRNNDGVFGTAWNDSDVVLVVEDHELHVHKWILKSQSPVFRAMFDGHFQEAGQERIVLSEKNFESMVEFLKVLYPSSMFGEERDDLSDESLLSILALTDEYQCINLIKQCINGAKITPEIVVEILPSVVKYHKTALPKLYDVMNWAVSMSRLEVEVLPLLENSGKLLLTKCHFLESTVLQLQNSMIYLMHDFLREANSRTCITVSDCSSHEILRITDVDKTKTCQNCKEYFKANFIPPFKCCKGGHTFKNNLLNLLQQGNDITNHALSTDEKQAMSWECNVINQGLTLFASNPLEY